MIRYRPETEVDFVIVGSGGAGGILAKELSVGGHSVVVLEQGPWIEQEHTRHDEFARDDVQQHGPFEDEHAEQDEEAVVRGQQVPEGVGQLRDLERGEHASGWAVGHHMGYSSAGTTGFWASPTTRSV